MTERMSSEAPQEDMPRRGRGWGGILVVVVVLVVGGVILWQAGVFDAGATAAASGYQAVFLTNNQVYFGNMKDPNTQYVTLTDIYYLQVNQQLQPPAEAVAQSLQLVKLGAELHGPTDEMRINRDHILFIEDLKDDSEIVKTIRDFQARTQSQ